MSEEGSPAWKMLERDRQACQCAARRAWKHPDASGKHPDASGKHHDASGKHPDASGKHHDASGKHHDASGKHPDASGKHPDASGKHHDASGKQFAASLQKSDASGLANESDSVSPAHIVSVLFRASLQTTGSRKSRDPPSKWNKQISRLARRLPKLRRTPWLAQGGSSPPWQAMRDLIRCADASARRAETETSGVAQLAIALRHYGRVGQLRCLNDRCWRVSDCTALLRRWRT